MPVPVKNLVVMVAAHRWSPAIAHISPHQNHRVPIFTLGGPQSHKPFCAMQ